VGLSKRYLDTNEQPLVFDPDELARTCREYEHQLFDYERQRRYRLESAG
jgi:hypothetical protein